MIGGFVGKPIGGVINLLTTFLSADSGAYTITGQAATFNENVTVAAGSYTINGSAALFATLMVSSAGSYAITGQAAVFNETVAATAGSYAITGQAALFAVLMPVTAGAYALTGQTAAFNPKAVVPAGAYAITGSAITFKINWVVAPGAYAITGGLVAFTQVINGAGGDKRLYRGKLEVARRKIRITDDEGRARQVDLLRRFKPPPPFTGPAPDWALPQDEGVAHELFDATPALPIAPTTMPAARLPQSLLALQDARDENELLEFLTNSPDPLVEDIRQVLGVLAASGQLEALLESA